MKRIIKFIGVGFTNTLIGYIVYTLLMMAAFAGNAEMAPLATGLSGAVATIVAFILHSKITWRERDPGKLGVIKFFIWNILSAILIRPALAALFELPVGLYQFAYMITSAMHLPFNYDFVQSTGIYVGLTVVTMVLNFICYEKFVFGAKVKVEEQQRKEIKVKSIRKTGEKEKSKSKAKHDTDK